MIELLAGCGNSRERKIRQAGPPWNDPEGWDNLVTLDIDPDSGADVIWNLATLPLPFPDDHFDAVHCFEVLEHTGQQGDWRFFFAQFAEFWRILKPGGRLIGTSPALASRWLWGDPGHSRVISPESMTFLCQPQYDKQVGVTPFTDYRHVYRADFEPIALDHDGEAFVFVLQAVKPSRCSK